MIFYAYKDKCLCALEDVYEYPKAVYKGEKEVYFLTKLPREKSKKTFAVASAADFYVKAEGLHQLCDKPQDWGGYAPSEDTKDLEDLISKAVVRGVNTAYPDYEECFEMKPLKKNRVHLLALGDVGSTLLIGLRLLGREAIGEIGIYDINPMVIKRWEYEANQITAPFEYDTFPKVHGITEDELFDCDMFVFCASMGIPPVGSGVKDVRMYQFEKNGALIARFAKQARDCGFKGIFSVVSDPVDPLCKTVYLESNKDDQGNFDGKGLAPEQIRGYGLGVMNGRALFYADRHPEMVQYKTEGRAFGPHGGDLIIADSITNYNDQVSKDLTKLVVEANLEVRAFGFKPYIAPAMSSGAISLIATLEGKWHYSSNFMGGVYMGAKNRLTPNGLEIERISMPAALYQRLEETYQRLADII